MDEMKVVVSKRDHRSIKKNEKLLVKSIYEFKDRNITFYGRRGYFNTDDFICLDGSPIRITHFTHQYDKVGGCIKFVTCRTSTYKYLEMGQVYNVSDVRETYKVVKVKLEGIKGWYQMGYNITPPTQDELTRFKIEQYKRMTALHNIYNNEEHSPVENNTITHDQYQDSH
jgi:hypothetical protein